MGENDFCFWDAKSIGDCIVLLCNSVFTAGILIVACIRLIKVARSREKLTESSRQTLLKLHQMVAVWGLCYLIQNSYSVGCFFDVLNTSPPPKDISDFSIKYSIIDKIPAFLVQSIFIQICLFYYKGFMSKIEASNFTKQQILFFRIVQIFFYLRILIQSLGILAILIFSGPHQIWISSTINVFIELTDSIVTSIILIVSLRIFLNKLRILQGMKSSDKSKLKRQYLIMIVTSILGVIVNIVFLLIFPLLGNIGDCIQNFANHLQFTIGHNIIGVCCLHFVPLTWILKIYNFQHNEETNLSLSLNHLLID